MFLFTTLNYPQLSGICNVSKASNILVSISFVRGCTMLFCRCLQWQLWVWNQYHLITSKLYCVFSEAPVQDPIATAEMLFFSLFGLVEPDYMPPFYSHPTWAKTLMKVLDKAIGRTNTLLMYALYPRLVFRVWTSGLAIFYICLQKICINK